MCVATVAVLLVWMGMLEAFANAGVVQNVMFETTEATATPGLALRAGATKDECVEYIHSQLDSLRGVKVLGGLVLAKGRTSSSRLEGGSHPLLQLKHARYK